MRVGVPSEIKVHEYRVGFDPPARSANMWRVADHVVVQSGAGAGIMAGDDAYRCRWRRNCPSRI